MHYRSDVTSAADKVWTREELERWLSEHFHGASPVFPDDAYYGKLANKDDLEILCEKIRKQLKLRKKPTYRLSETVKSPGTCVFYDNKLILELPTIYLRSPLQAAAGISHLMAHGLLLTQKKQHLDHQENERMADSACIQAGLGLVVLNGVHASTWSRLMKRAHHSSAAIGYFTVEQFIHKFLSYASLKNIDTKRIQAHVVDRLRPFFANNQKIAQKDQPRILLQTKQRDNRQFKEFVWLTAFIGITVVGAVYFSFKTPDVTDKKLSALKASAEELRSSYETCVARYTELENTLPLDQISSVRLLSYEQTRCKSLENRYNTASKTYNEYLHTKR